MSSIRKIWSAPIAALALVLMLVGVVFAQTPPTVGAEIPDQTITIIASAETAVIDLANVDTDLDGTGDGAAAFTEVDASDPLAYTAVTSDPSVAHVAIENGDNNDVANAWWDALDDTDDTDCSAKATRLGFTVGAADGNTPADTSGTPAAVGLCQDTGDSGFSDLAVVPDGSDAGTDPDLTAGDAVPIAFHWDMLSAEEMNVAATAAGESDAEDYEHNFGALTDDQKLDVVSWFGDDNILARGTGGDLTLTNDGITGADTDGEAGTATIAVKASDAEGRLIPPPDGSETVGQTFTVTASLTPTGDIADFGGTESTTDSRLGSIDDSGVEFVPEAGAGTTATPARYDVSIKADSDNVAQITAVVGVGTLAAHHQKLEFHIVEGASDMFGIRPTDPAAANMAEIYVRSGANLEPLMEESFTLQVNEVGNQAANYQQIEVRVRVIPGAQELAIEGTLPDADNPIELTEDDMSDAIVVNSMTSDGENRVLYDFAVNVVDDTPDESLTYTLMDASAPFMLGTGDDGSKLMISDDGIAKTEAGSRSDDGTLDDPTNDYSDITYEFSVRVTDASANTVTIPVVVKVDVNEPVSVSATTDAGEYVSTDPLSHTIVDVGALVDGGNESGDTLTYAMVTTPTIAPFEIDTATGQIQISFPGRNYDGGEEWTAVVTIDDDFANSDLTAATDDAAEARDPDATVTVTITAVKGDPPPILLVDVTIPEDTAGGDEIADLSDEIADAMTYTASGGDGQDKFSVGASDGKVTVNADADLDVDAPGTDDNYLLVVNVAGANNINLGQITVVIEVIGVNEAPMFEMASSDLSVDENAQPGTDVGDSIMATDPDGDVITFSVKSAMTGDGEPAMGSPFIVVAAVDDDGNAMPGYAQVRVSGAILLANSPYTVVIEAKDNGEPMMSAEHTVTITLGDVNDAPIFDEPVTTTAMVTEAASAGAVLATYNATDPDGDDIIEGLRYELGIEDRALFEIVTETDIDAQQITGTVKVKDGLKLEYDVQQDSPAAIVYKINVKACDGESACNEFLELDLTLENSNDESPVIGNTDDSQDVPENSPRGTSLGDYGATDKDNINAPGFDTITYTLEGTNAKSFQVSDTGELMTLESLDYDRPVPCRTCNVTVVATDEAGNFDRQDVTISVTPVEDSVSTLGVTKANPVPGTSMGDSETAFGGTKDSMGGIEESPADLPSSDGMPMNFVDSDWANWGTVLRIAVTAQSPDDDCGNGNQCVVVHLNSDSADDTLELEAYRSADQENKFVAAVMLVELESDATNLKDEDGDDIPVYKHTDMVGSVARLQVDEEDEVEIEFGNLRSSIDVENEAPEIDNFSPAHEMAFDDADVDYTFTITDAHSGLPEPEDLPDTNGDADYTPVVALISRDQCETHMGTEPEFEVDGDVLQAAAHIHEDETLYCPGTEQSGEYNAASGGWGFAPIRDDKDFNEIDDGYDVETTIVLTEDRSYYVTFIVCDNAGNCAFYDPDGNDDDEELAQITVDTKDPVFEEARTGLMWDATDNEYDDDRSFIQVIFNELTQINPATVEVDDFVVEGHVVKSVHVFENPDDEDVNWDDSAGYGTKGKKNDRGEDMYRDIENTVFIELEDELLADETPDVTLVPNGVEDSAGNEQDDGEQEADDWISPAFTIVSIISPRETSQSEVLAGDDEEVVITVTADERLDQTRPTVTVTYVNAPAGSVDSDGTDPCDTDEGDDKGTRDRGEIINGDKCQDNVAATGGELNKSVEKVSNTEWVVTITEPKATGYYNFHITGVDRSSQANRGSEGVNPDEIVTEFFDSDGDVNVDDAVFFEGDINLANPNVRVSGEVVTDDEPDVEFRSPLFVEIDFTKNHMGETECRDDEDNDHMMANCVNENSEYAEDNFDDVVITMFELDGVDMTSSVKTTDDQTFLVSLENVSVGDHTFKVQAMDQAGNMLEDVLEIDFEVSDRDPFERRLNPGWNLVSLPGEPADSSIASVFGSGVEVRTVYTYDPVVPGGWMVAVRETLESDWQGDLMEINGQQGYWVLSDAIQDWEVNIPRLAGGAAGTGTPIQPPSIPLYAGWNLIPVTDVTGNALDGGETISAMAYLQGLNDGIEAARVLGFDTIMNVWSTIDAEDDTSNLMIGSGYWVFVREATTLVPGQ